MPELVGTRRALALVVLGFIWTTFALMGLVAPEPVRPMFLGLSATYLLAFLGIGAGYFWGRWYANGLGWSGAWTLLGVGQVDDPRPLLIWAGMHIAVLALLAGRAMHEAYEGRADWRARLRVKDENVGRIGAIVTTIASLLPMLVGQLLRRPDPTDIVMLGGAATGLYLLLRMRTAGILLFAGVGALSLLGGEPVFVALGPSIERISFLGPVVGLGLIAPFVWLLPAIVRTLRRP